MASLGFILIENHYGTIVINPTSSPDMVNILPAGTVHSFLIILLAERQVRAVREPEYAILVTSHYPPDITIRKQTFVSPVVGQCKPLVKCVRFFHEIPTLQSQPCQLPSGASGVCCPYVVIGFGSPQNGKSPG